MSVPYETYFYGRHGSALTYNGFVLGSEWWPNIQLPPFTLRILFTDGTVPTTTAGTWTQVSSSPNIWDIHYENTNWEWLLTRGDAYTGPNPAIPYPTAHEVRAVIGANTTGVQNMRHLLGECQYMVRVCPMDTSSVTNMEGMFTFCKRLRKIPPMDTSNVTTMEHMFENCTAITGIPFMDTSNVTNMYTMFNGCYNLKTIPSIDTSNVTTMYWMFTGCSKLETIPLLDTSSVRDMTQMFSGCSSLVELPLLDTSSAALFNGFCRGCTSLSYIPDFSIASLYGGNFTDMFRNCNNVAYGSYNMYVKLNNHMGGQLPPSNLNKVFSNCGIDSPTGLVELNKIPVTYGGLKPIA